MYLTYLLHCCGGLASQHWHWWKSPGPVAVMRPHCEAWATVATPRAAIRNNDFVDIVACSSSRVRLLSKGELTEGTQGGTCMWHPQIVWIFLRHVLSKFIAICQYCFSCKISPPNLASESIQRRLVELHMQLVLLQVNTTSTTLLLPPTRLGGWCTGSQSPLSTTRNRYMHIHIFSEYARTLCRTIEYRT